MAKIIGSALPNIPWQEPPANTRTPSGAKDANPIIGRDGNARSNSVFNSAVVAFQGWLCRRIPLRQPVHQHGYFRRLQQGRSALGY